MKTTSTLKSLLGAGLLLCAGAFSSSAQSNGVAVSDPQLYTVAFDADLLKSVSPEKVDITSSSNVSLGKLRRIGDRLVFDVTFDGSVPLTTIINFTVSDIPYWHVTVADILGQTEGTTGNNNALRPINISDVITPDNDNNTSPTAVAQPGPQSVTGSNDGIAKPQPKMDVYPNPATEYIIIVTEGEVLWGVVEVIDITGKKILEVPTGVTSPANGIDRVTLTVSQLKPGTYFARFKTNKDVYTKRFQVAR